MEEGQKGGEEGGKTNKSFTYIRILTNLQMIILFNIRICHEELYEYNYIANCPEYTALSKIRSYLLSHFDGYPYSQACIITDANLQLVELYLMPCMVLVMCKLNPVK